MKKALQNRIALANKYIKFAIKHGIMAEDYFGGTFPVIMTFEKPIEVSPTGRVVTVQWKDGYDMRPHKEKIYPNKFDGEEELRYTITAIIRGIKKGAKQDGWTIGHKGQSFSSKRSNPRRRKNTPQVRIFALKAMPLQPRHIKLLQSITDEFGDPTPMIDLVLKKAKKSMIVKLTLQQAERLYEELDVIQGAYSKFDYLPQYQQEGKTLDQFNRVYVRHLIGALNNDPLFARKRKRAETHPHYATDRAMRGKLKNPRRRKNTRRRIRKYSLRENDAIPTYKVAMQNIKDYLKQKGWSIRGDYGQKGDFVLLFKKQTIHIGLKYRTKTESLRNLYGSMHLPDIRTLSMRELDQDIAYYQRILRER
jgi:hypothetical protein